MRLCNWLEQVRFLPLGRAAVLIVLALSCYTTTRGDDGIAAVPASDFLNSIGTQSAISVRGESLDKTIDCCKYLGVRWLRAGIEGDVPLQHFFELHKRAGVRFSWGLGSGGSDIGKLIQTSKPLATKGAIVAFEGPNEPNNWGITYQGQTGGRDRSWIPIAKLQSDLYKAVKGDAALEQIPVWSITEGGAETDNVGLQFLTIPPGAGTIMPAGTRFADYANVHNYFYHPNSSGIEDNKTWNAADPTSACKVDGLYGEYGRTWARHYPGYSAAELLTLPRVTTETGTTIDGPITEEIHALNLLTLYLDQFKRGWSFTANYLLRDRVDEGGNQKFGFYRPDYTPRKAAVYLHNLTTILADHGSTRKPGKLKYTVSPRPATVHELLLRNSAGEFQLIVWNERVTGSDKVTVNLGDIYTSVKLYDPTIGWLPIQALTNLQTIPLMLSDHPMVLEIVPGGA